MASRDYWSMTEGVWCCLIDRERSLAFGDAIAATVRPGDVVVDAGTGSGILALMAASVGAKRVYAIENDSKNLRHLKATFAANGLSRRITLLEDDATTCSLPEPVDVVICEMVATGLIEELQVPAMNNLHRFASPRMRPVIADMTHWIELVESPQDFYGYVFPIPRYEYPGEKRLSSRALSSRIRYHSTSFVRPITQPHVRWQGAVRVLRDGIANGLRVSTVTRFFNGSRFGASFAYAYPIVLPIVENQVCAGDELQLYLSYTLCRGFGSLKYRSRKMGSPPPRSR